jgi:glycogen(starch) synthase
LIDVRVLMVSWEYPPVVVGGLGRHVSALAGGLAELVTDGVTGLSFAPGDVAAIAAAVSTALADPAAARTRARTARDRLADEFDWRRITAQTADVYAAARVRPTVELGRPKIPTGNAFGPAG